MQIKLSKSFYTNPNTIEVARSLLGKVLVSSINGVLCSGVISETEAYLGASDKASHAYGNRRTARTEIMYSKGGVAYVYLCYGIHKLFNVVSGNKNDPQAILIRELLPVNGLDQMCLRRNTNVHAQLCNGPGKLTQAMGIDLRHNGLDLSSDVLWIEDRGSDVQQKDISVNPRIGVDYAGKDALLPYRFTLKSAKMNDVTWPGNT